MHTARTDGLNRRCQSPARTPLQVCLQHVAAVVKEPSPVAELPHQVLLATRTILAATATQRSTQLLWGTASPAAIVAEMLAIHTGQESFLEKMMFALNHAGKFCDEAFARDQDQVEGTMAWLR